MKNSPGEQDEAFSAREVDGALFSFTEDNEDIISPLPLTVICQTKANKPVPVFLYYKSRTENARHGVVV